MTIVARFAISVIERSLSISVECSIRGLFVPVL
jgi:hypothetical protein